ncbi:hypothetical protein U8335_21070 [Roseiconus lacunae]|uniref:hypothetical protein n=1 Tax=Roseiconus lacunae TaxID=2605694 RepID=UPI0030932438|nr:hypothetical protein U8335_21070 [Stieleria sp. HD01]
MNSRRPIVTSKQRVTIIVLVLMIGVALAFPPSEPSGSVDSKSVKRTPPANRPRVSLTSLRPHGDDAKRLENDEINYSVRQLERLDLSSLQSLDLFSVRPKVINDQPAMITRPDTDRPDAVPKQDLTAQPSATSTPTIETEPNVDTNSEFIVNAVYGSANETQHRALVNGVIVLDGDELESGLRVLSVSPEQIELVPSGH